MAERYRMEVDASVMFDIVADSPEEAKAEAHAFLDQYLEGLSVDGVEGDMRVYVEDKHPAYPSLDIADVFESDEEDGFPVHVSDEARMWGPAHKSNN